MIQKLVKKIFGTRSDREIKQLYPIVDNINQLADSLKNKTDEELRERSLELRQDLINNRKKAEKNASNTFTDKDERIKFILKTEHE